jgi:hypothetical protein
MIPSKAPAPPSRDFKHTSSTANLTTRDYFAAAAMQGELSCQTAESGWRGDLDALARYSYKIADAMLKARK